MLKINNVSKKIGSFQLQDISFELPKGYLMGLVGTNGAGKTTLLHVLLGLYTPDKGEVIIDGMDYTEHEKEIKDMTGVVLSEELFDADLTLKQNGQYYGKYYSKYDETLLESYAARFNLDSNCKYGKMSKGEKLKFQFAFALSHNPRLLILDEPTANFDPDFIKEFFKILGEFISDGEKSVILATHLTADLDRVADYITYLEKGKLLLSESIEDLRNHYKIISGEAYKVKLYKDSIIHMEERQFVTRALVKNRRFATYDRELTVTDPTVEEIMYYMTKK